MSPQRSLVVTLCFLCRPDIGTAPLAAFWKLYVTGQYNRWIGTRLSYLTDPGEARGCSKNSLVIDSSIHSFSQPFPPTALRHHHAQTVRNTTSSYKIDYVIVMKNFLIPEGHHNPISGSKVTAILLKGWIYPIGAIPCQRSEKKGQRQKVDFWIRQSSLATQNYNSQ